MSPNSPQTKKVRQVRNNDKFMLIFFDIPGFVHKEFVPPYETVNGKVYCMVLKRLR
jgi:GTPase Era involved in 16S rRNA processing